MIEYKRKNIVNNLHYLPWQARSRHLPANNSEKKFKKFTVQNLVIYMGEVLTIKNMGESEKRGEHQIH